MARYYYPDVRMRLDDERYFIPTKIAGVGYRQDAASRCYEGQNLALIRDSENSHDKNAIKVFAGGEHIGFIPAEVNEGFAEYLDSGRKLEADIYKIVGGTKDKPNRGIYINLYLPEDVSVEFDNEPTLDRDDYNDILKQEADQAKRWKIHATDEASDKGPGFCLCGCLSYATTSGENCVDVRYGSDLHRVNCKRCIRILEKRGLR